MTFSEKMISKECENEDHVHIYVGRRYLFSTLQIPVLLNLSENAQFSFLRLKFQCSKYQGI